MKDQLDKKGLAIRQQVLGDEYVERSLQNADEFAWPLQELVTRYCWGEIWSRPGLDRKSRSLLNLGMLTALNRPHEFRIHVRGALHNGVSREEIREVLLQAAIYCGVPAAMEGFKLARQVFDDVDGKD